MGIESVDRIERMTLADAPDIFEAIGTCGMIFTIEKCFQTIWETPHGDFPAFIVRVTEGSEPVFRTVVLADQEYNVLVPDTLDDPVTQAEIVLALHDKGIDF